MEVHLASAPIETASSRGKRRTKIVWKRMAIQLTFIFIHVALIKFAIPNMLWAVIGLAFWGTLIVLAARSGRWVCSTFCWLGGIQDLFYGIAQKRVNFNPKIFTSDCVRDSLRVGAARVGVSRRSRAGYVGVADSQSAYLNGKFARAGGAFFGADVGRAFGYRAWRTRCLSLPLPFRNGGSSLPQSAIENAQC
jgi:hypothetical protein